MKQDIETIKVFPLIVKNEWCFRCSVAYLDNDRKHIMLFVFNLYHKDVFMIRYYDSIEMAEAAVDEICAGKHFE